MFEVNNKNFDFKVNFEQVNADWALRAIWYTDCTKSRKASHMSHLAYFLRYKI